MELKDAIKNRRSCYALTKVSTIPDAKILELVEHGVRYVPSSFNSQSQRVAVLLGAKHDQLWDIVMETLRGIVPAAGFAATEAKINSFKAGYGTILYFDDTTITTGLQKQYPLYADKFPVWAEQANGMLQNVLWMSLTAEGLGANLQHYNPLIDAQLGTAFGIPDGWRLIAQMPFGTPAAIPAERPVASVSDRIMVV